MHLTYLWIWWSNTQLPWVSLAWKWDLADGEGRKEMRNQNQSKSINNNRDWIAQQRWVPRVRVTPTLVFPLPLYGRLQECPSLQLWSAEVIFCDGWLISSVSRLFGAIPGITWGTKDLFQETRICNLLRCWAMSGPSKAYLHMCLAE